MRKLNLSIILICLSSGCASVNPEAYNPPKISQCFIGEFSLQCFDPRAAEDVKSYTVSFDDAINYYCTNPTDRATEKEWIERLKNK